MNNTLTALRGVKVGHSTHIDKLTGCTVILFDKPVPAAYKAYGGAVGGFNTNTLENGQSDYRIDALFVSGGSSYGLGIASEIMTGLVEKKIGSSNGVTINPNICGAIVYDLGMRQGQFDLSYGREALEAVSSDQVKNGNVGAGTGTAIGKFQYLKQSETYVNAGMKAGIGSARVDLGNGIIVCALSVVNAIGNVILPNGEILAGNRSDKTEEKFSTFESSAELHTGKTNTTISIVGINANLGTRENYERIAHIASHGQVRAINPVHTSIDGDTIFVFSTEEVDSFLTPIAKSIAEDGWENLGIDFIGHAASKAVQQSIYDACYKAESVKIPDAFNGIIPSANDY